MMIKKFWAKGYRSLHDITLDGLGKFSIFYGPNGSGKSNVIDAVQTLFYVMPLAVDTAYGPPDERLSFREAGRRAAAWIREDDFFAREETQAIEMGAVLEDPGRFDGALFQGQPVRRVEVGVRFSRARPGEFNLQFTRLFINGRPPGLPFTDPTIRDLLRSFVPQEFTHLGVTRTLSVNAFGDGEASSARVVGTIPDGEVVRELFRAKNAKDSSLRRRFEQLREFMATVLHRGLFDVFMDPDTQDLELREMLPEPNPLQRDIRVDHAGHGVVQMYAIVATIMLGGGHIVAIEEPEAHLHAPTLGRELRFLLKSMVDEGRVGQLFIATHSNLFDLDPDGYWDVSMAGGKTRAERKPLHEIDARHLYEPGPAKHALGQLLRYAPEDEVVFRRPDGAPVTAKEMLRLLQEDDETAVEFLHNLHGAALRIVRLDARRKGSAT
jgi:hypothetical protein